MSATMLARFGTTCSSCADPIQRGDLIRYTPGMAATHEHCGEPAVELARRPSRSSRRRRPMFNRCTHEDYPCCGCGPDAGR